MPRIAARAETQPEPLPPSANSAALDKQLRDGWLLGTRHLDRKLGDIPVETLVIDDELKPDVDAAVGFYTSRKFVADFESTYGDVPGT
jgi:hypothetical protein